MKGSRSKTFSVILLIIITLLIILYFLNNTTYVNLTKKNVTESLDNMSNDVKIWTLSESDNKWYTLSKGGYSTTLEKMGFTPNNPKMSITFYVKLTTINNTWRNIFHFTNDRDCCGKGNRIPAMWFHGNNTRLHIRFSTDSNGNDGIDTDNIIPFSRVGGKIYPDNKPVHVAIVFNGDNFKYYLNGILMHDRNFKGMMSRKPSTKLYIADPFYGSDGGIQISDFTVYDCELVECKIKDIEKKKKT